MTAAVAGVADGDAPSEPREILADVARAMSDAGWTALLKLGSGPVPDQLFIALEPDGRGRIMHLQVSLLAMGELPALQYFVGLPYPTTGAEPAALCRLLCALNPDLPVSGFEFSEAQAMLFFQHRHFITIESFRLDVVAWNTTMIDFLITRFGPLLEAAAGGLPFAAGRQRLVSLIAELT